MDFETLKKKYDKLVDTARKTRGHQKEYFKYRASSDLKLARKYELLLDNLLKEEVAVQESKQSELF